MKLWLVTVAILSTIFGVVACAPKAQNDCGYVQNVYGERISWKGRLPIELSVHESFPTDKDDALKTAIKTWNESAGREVFRLKSTTRVKGPLTPMKDRENVLYYYDETKTETSWEADKTSEQARTSVYWVGDLIQEADIRVNGMFHFYTLATTDQSDGKVNMEALLIHELGHVLGLKHKDEGGSVMATYLAESTERTKISDADLQALRCEY